MIKHVKKKVNEKIENFKEKKRQQKRDFFYQEMNKFLDELNAKIKKNHFNRDEPGGGSGIQSWTFEHMCLDKAIYALGSFITYRDQRISEATSKPKSQLPEKPKKKRTSKIVKMGGKKK